MGGLIVVVLWPMILPIVILKFLDVALPIIAPIVLAWNLLVLAALLVARHFWKRTGTMDRTYIDALGGWKRVVFLLLRWGLMFLIIWEILLLIACVFYLFWGAQPLS